MSKQISKIYHAAIYVRLSKEDGDVSTSAKAESNSISNQKDFIRNFLADKKDIRIVKEYVDDGYSGSNFDRPSFQTMMEDIKRGVIDCVVVKDLSRFGREYIDSGRYIERLFPALGVRFIAINDNYDSVTGKSQGDEIIIPFKNLINDAYCRDISIKIRSHLDVKRKNGEYIGAFVPYGYEKSDDDKHKLVIDTYAAGIVKEIFRLKLHGMSQDAIATQLNDEGVLAPMEYKQSTGSGYQTGFLQNEKSVWSSVTVRRILENEIYIGNLVQGKRTTPNHKVKQEVVKPESDWIRIEKNHEPIISNRDYEIVQRLLGMDTRISPDSDVVYNLSGIAVCADCGSPMTRKITTAGDKKYAYYICSNHKLTKQCSQHSISVSLLEDTVLEMLKLHIKNVMNLEEILVIIDPVQAFLGADVDMNRANEVRPIFRSLGDIAQATGCAIVLIGHLNKAAGTQSTYRGLGSIDITAAVRSLLFIGKLKDSPTTRVLIHEKSSLAPPGQSLAFSLGDEKGFEWIGAYDITADELLAGTDTAKTESKTAQAQMLILELLADGKRMPSAELEKAVNERGISSRTMRTAKSRIGDRLVTEKDGTAWVCYLRD